MKLMNPGYFILYFHLLILPIGLVLWLKNKVYDVEFEQIFKLDTKLGLIKSLKEFVKLKY